MGTQVQSLLLQFGEPFSYWLLCSVVPGHSYLYSMALISPSQLGVLPLSLESSPSEKRKVVEVYYLNANGRWRVESDLVFIF